MNSLKKSQCMLWPIILCGVMLSGCGGSGGSTPINADAQIKGVVVDGYLVGAKVCLDINSNWVCDAGEPSTTSVAGGKFSLDVSPLRYWETYDKLVIAEVGPDAKDEAVGKTLKEQGQTGYVLAAWGGSKPVLSPISTLKTSQNLLDGVTPDDTAPNDLISSLLRDNGMSTVNQDYFDSTVALSLAERLLAQRTGRVLATALSGAQARLKSEVLSVYGVSNDGLGARAASVVTQALQSTRAASVAESESDQLVRVNQQVASMALNAEYEKLLKKSVITLPVTEALSVLTGGVFDTSLLSSTPRALVSYSVASDNTSTETTSLQYRGNAWVKDAAYQSQGAAGYHLLYSYRNLADPNSIESAVIHAGSPLLVKDSLVLKEKFSSNASTPIRQVQVLARDVEGLPFSSLPALSAFTGGFGSGQKVYQIRRKATMDEYVFEGVASFFTSLSAFKSSPRTCYAGVCWSISSSAGPYDLVFEGTMKFSTTSSGGSLDLGDAQFVEESLGGVRFLRMKTIPVAVQNRSPFWSAKDGRYPVFADFDGKLWVGHYAPSGTTWTSDWLLPRDALNAVLTSVPLTSLLP